MTAALCFVACGVLDVPYVSVESASLLLWREKSLLDAAVVATEGAHRREHGMVRRGVVVANE